MLTLPEIVKCQYDSIRLKKLYDYCLDMPVEFCDSLYHYSIQIDSISKKINYYKGKLFSQRLMGMYLEFHYDYEGAISYYLQTLDESRRLNEKNYEACALGDLAQAYVSLKNTAQAKKYYLQSVAMARQTSNTNLIASTYNNVGAIYNESGNYDSAMYFFNMALAEHRKSKSTENVYNIYNNMAITLLHQKQYDLAFNYLNQNYLNHIKEGDRDGVRWYDLINFSEFYLHTSNLRKAQF